METNEEFKDGAKGPAEKEDRVEIAKILGLMVVSFFVGFGLIFLFLPSRQNAGSDWADAGPAVLEKVAQTVETPVAPAPAMPASPAADAGSANAPDPVATAPASQDGGGAVAAQEPSPVAPNEGDLPAEVPPGRTPDGVAQDGGAFYLKCFESANVEHPGAACDRLPVLEKRFSTRLYVVDKCRRLSSGDAAKGKLSLGVEVDFGATTVNFWNGASSTVTNAAKIATCLRTELKGLPIQGLEHKYNRYRMFLTVIFGGAAGKASSPEQKKDAPSATAAKPAPKVKGRTMEVVQDHVRVRVSPKDGAVLGKISKGKKVQLLEKKAGWCHIITPKNNDGWMTCDALGQ